MNVPSFHSCILSISSLPDLSFLDMQYQYGARDTGISAGWNKLLVASVCGAGVAGHVELDVVVDDLSRDVSANRPERPINGSRLELAHRTALDADRVVMTMTNASEAVHVGSVHHEELADDSRLEKEFDGPIYR